MNNVRKYIAKNWVECIGETILYLRKIINFCVYCKK